ncbi:Dehydrogenase [Seminavis robusta]|uniref:Dehydrogenase n=1 Tax=Seminavis robusta TaxID=568900 RepID=A0A9N8E0L3_9STRA|nr:Dehydrogenase [Seminavis robusta]|eukprot:Sro529_g160980.1 Dehydrogenase (371) ;mRNA; f:20165-21277
MTENTKNGDNSKLHNKRSTARIMKSLDSTHRALNTMAILAFLLLLFLFYWYWTSDEFVTPAKIAEWSSHKTIVITGANSVVSFGVLVHLLRANTAEHIIMACRSDTKCQATLAQVQQHLGVTETTTSKVKVSLVSLDLTSRASIEQCAKSIIATAATTQQQQSSISKLSKNMILVWNANDSVHDPIMVNGMGHLYLTHLLYPQLQRVVVAASIVGGVPWDVLQPWEQSSYPSWFQLPAQYGTSKRTMLFLAQQLLLLQQSQSSQPQLQVVATQAGLTCDETEACHAISMTPIEGAHSHLRAMLDPDLQPGAYLGHRWILWGKTIIAGTLESSWYHMHLSGETRQQLWAWSLKELGIQEFGNNPSASTTTK